MLHYRLQEGMNLAAFLVLTAISRPAAGQSAPAPGVATSSPQAAENSVAAGQSQVSEIVVTAQRRSESLSRVGATVSVIGAQELANQGVKTTSDLTRFVPGFQATQSYNGNPVYILRGVGFNSPNANATAPVGLYLDETAIPYPYMSLGVLFDLERVEVLKGPQGTLYGRNATGGLVNFVSAKPTQEFKAGGTVEVGNYQTVNSTGFISGPIADGLAARVAFDSQNRDEGYQQSVTRNDRLGILHQNSFRGIVDFNRGGPFTATLTGSYWKRLGDTLAPQSIQYLPAPGGNPLARASVIANPTSDTQADWAPVEHQTQLNQGITRPAPLVDSSFYSATLKATYAFSSALQLSSLTSYDNLHHRDAADLGGFQIVANFQDVAGEITSFSQELRLIGISERLNWSIGGYYAKDTSHEEQIGYNDENNTIAVLRTISESLPQTRFTQQQISESFGNYDDRSSGNNQVLAVFANGDYQFNNRLKLTLGGRYTEDTARQNACTYDYRGGNIPVIDLFYGLLFGKTYNLQPGQCYTLQAGSTDFVDGSVASYQKQNNLAWKAVLDYTPSGSTLIYGSVSRGFKAGGFPLIAASSAAQFASIKQEQLTSYELGAKLGLFDRAVQLNASGFYYDYLNKQLYGRVADVIFGTLSRVDNIPKSREFGIEGDLKWQLNPALQFDIAGVYLDSKILEYSSFDQFSNFRDFSGRPYPYTPKFQGNALALYDQPVTNNLRLNGSISVSYQTETSASVADLSQFKVKPYALVGSTLGISSRDKRWNAEIFVQNLFNTYYYSGVESLTDSIFRFAGLPRMAGVRLSCQY